MRLPRPSTELIQLVERGNAKDADDGTLCELDDKVPQKRERTLDAGGREHGAVGAEGEVREGGVVGADDVGGCEGPRGEEHHVAAAGGC